MNLLNPTWQLGRSRPHLRAHPDPLYFHLYDLDHNNAAYILSTSPIIQRHDQTQFGRYGTEDRILA